VTIVLAVIDVAPHLAARKTHRRSLEVSVISEKDFQHNLPQAVIPWRCAFHTNSWVVSQLIMTVLLTGKRTVRSAYCGHARIRS
jgi:hypothetical protein